MKLALTSLAMAAFIFIAATCSFANDRPNIILIMADDLGVEGLQCYGGQSYKTPRLNKLAKQGIRFTQAYAQPLCTNTRIQLMTGKYNNRNWLYFGILDPNEKTFGHFMKEQGYDTCMSGKWQLQSYDPPDYPGSAKRRGTGMKIEDSGFDRLCMWHVAHTEDKGSRYADPRIHRDGELLDLKGEFGPDVFVDYITDFLEEKKNSEKPFFIYYPMALPHWPMVPTPDSPEWQDPSRRHEEDVRYIKDMVEYTDKCVGRIVDKVDSLGIAEETLILFYSDNGTNLKVTSQTRKGPVQGGKGLTTDAGTHVPMIARWSGKIEPGINRNLIDSTDFLPTIVEAAGGEISDDTKLDGISFYPQLIGENETKRRWIFSHFDPRPGWDKDRFTKVRFARNRKYKLYGDGRMFDVPNDKLEKNPLNPEDDSEMQANVRKRLQRILNRMPNPDTPERD